MNIARANAAAVVTAALAAVIVLGCALAAKWAVVVPIYQNPDEPVHADYAFALIDAGRLLRYDGRGSTTEAFYADPMTHYLVGATRTFAIAFHPYQRVVPDYGTRAAFRSIDEGAPWPQAHAYRRNPSPTPSLQYPYGYYALAALAGAAARAATQSLVATFFAMRFLGVVLLGATLVCAYFLLRFSGMPAWAAVCAVAIVGTLPEQTSISSAVQPDDLSQTLVTAVLLAAVQARRTERTSWIVATGVLLGFLYVTKVQYWLAAAAAVVPLFAALAVRRRQFARATSMAAALVVPLIAFASIQSWVSAGKVVASVSPAPLAGALHGAMVHGPLAVAAYVPGAVLGAARTFLYDGQSARSYWGDFGWLDTPLVLGTPQTTANLLSAVGIGSCVTAAFAGLLFIRVIVRCVAAFRRGHRRAALYLAARDPAATALLAFSAVMTGLYVVWGDFGFQGRYWLPLAVPVWYVAAHVAPAWLNARRARRFAAAAVLLPMLAFVCAEAAFAFPTIVARYYSPYEVFAAQRRAFIDAAEPVRHNIESVRVGNCDNVTPGAPASCRGNDFIAQGWAIPDGPLHLVVLHIDGTRKVITGATISRPDVAQAFHDPTVQMSGFQFETGVPYGTHELRLGYLSDDDVVEFLSPEIFHVVVTAPH